MSLTMKEKWERRIIPFLMETLGGILVAVALDSFAVNAEFPLTGFSAGRNHRGAQHPAGIAVL